MNQKYYTGIAKIIKFNRDNSYDAGIKLLDFVSKQLADYFEKEDNQRVEYAKNHLPLPTKEKKFNKKQFLKDCGIN